MNRCEEQSFKHVRAEGGEWNAKENECFCAELAGVLCMITEVVFCVSWSRWWEEAAATDQYSECEIVSLLEVQQGFANDIRKARISCGKFGWFSHPMMT